METGLHADRAATVKAVLVSPGSQIDAKDLLIELEAARPGPRSYGIPRNPQPASRPPPPEDGEAQG